MKTTDKADKRILLTFIAMGIIPLIVFLVQRELGLSRYDWFSNTDTETDFFLVYKMYAVYLVLTAMLVVLGFDMYQSNKYSVMIKDKLAANKAVFIMSALYLVLALLSSISAHDKSYAFGGGYAEHESFFVLAGYIVMFVYTYSYLNNISVFMKLYRLFIVAVALMALLGVMQYFGKDFFASMAGKSIITMFTSIKPEQISFKFEPGRVYLTLYNPNYVGSYVGLVLPLTAIGVYVFEKMWEKILAAITAVMLVICLIGSWSTTGMTGILAAALLVFVIMLRRFAAYKKVFLVSLVSFVCVAVTVAAANYDKMKQAFEKYSVKEDNFAISAIETGEDSVRVDINGQSLYVSLDDSAVTLKGTDGKPVRAIYSEAAGGIITDSHEAYEGLLIKGAAIGEDSRGFSINYEDKSYVFTKDAASGRYLYYNVFGKLTDKINNADRVLFDNHEQFASGRGFIWSRSIPLLKKNILIGCGPDNFIFEFPNDDYVSLMNVGYVGEVVTRPHNMYLQTGVQTGLLSLVLFVLIYALYFVQSIRIYMGKKREADPEQNIRLRSIGMMIFAGSFAYMICGLANDSTICVAPVFWCMLGAGFASNYLICNYNGGK